ncbi:MAG: hypothetical protein NZ949_08340, partial [Candidatus Kapabacteria bacterium]|nr:hypothetical protein [Candidatus Kapabacteria bacterium]MDW7996176.1 hypothetical protein [Bacteroidota bacterium]
MKNHSPQRVQHATIRYPDFSPASLIDERRRGLWQVGSWEPGMGGTICIFAEYAEAVSWNSSAKCPGKLMVVGVLAWIGILVSIGSAQEQGYSPVQFRGTLSATAEAYTSSGEALAQRFMPRYGARLFFRPVLQLFGQVELPFELMLSSSTGMRTGSTFGFLQPFNQIGLSPRIASWLRVHAGYFSLRLSELSFGELRVLGGGMELFPGLFRLQGLYGVVQHPRSLDTASGFTGTYRRWAWGASVGFSTEGGTEILLHYVRLTDDTNSIRLVRILRDTVFGRIDSVVTPAQDNAVAALSFRLPLMTGVTMQGEIAISAYSSSLRAPEKESGLPHWLFVPRYSSNVDGAALVSATIVPSRVFSINLGGRWIGPG